MGSYAGNVETLNKSLERFFEQPQNTTYGMPVPARFVLDRQMRDRVVALPRPSQYIKRKYF